MKQRRDSQYGRAIPDIDPGPPQLRNNRQIGVRNDGTLGYTRGPGGVENHRWRGSGQRIESWHRRRGFCQELNEIDGLTRTHLTIVRHDAEIISGLKIPRTRRDGTSVWHASQHLGRNLGIQVSLRDKDSGIAVL